MSEKIDKSESLDLNTKEKWIASSVCVLMFILLGVLLRMERENHFEDALKQGVRPINVMTFRLAKEDQHKRMSMRWNSVNIIAKQGVYRLESRDNSRFKIGSDKVVYVIGRKSDPKYVCRNKRPVYSDCLQVRNKR